MMAKVTLKQIAEEAGVSVTTVSNVYNNLTQKVSKDVRDRILEIIKRRNYSPDMNARALVSSSSKLIGLLYYSKDRMINFKNPFVADILSGVEYKSKENGYFVLIHNFQYINDLNTIQKNWKFAGFIIVGLHANKFYSYKKVIRVPSVYIDTNLKNIDNNEDSDVFFVTTNDRELSRIATLHQLDLGHRQIGFLSYNFSIDFPNVLEQRFLGYKDAMCMRDHKQNIECIIYSHEHGFNMIGDKLSRMTAVVVSADILAAELVVFMRDKGLKLSIVSFDDISLARFLDPPLSTVRLNQVKKCKEAFNILFKRFNEDMPSSIELSGELVVRKSSYVLE